jgi:hypothetical protein
MFNYIGVWGKIHRDKTLCTSPVSQENTRRKIGKRGGNN